MAFDCVDIEKAFVSVPNELAFEVMSCMKAGEAEVKAVEAIYKDNTAMVIFEGEISVAFGVRVGFMIGKYIDAPVGVRVGFMIGKYIDAPVGVRVGFMIGKYIDAPVVHYIGKEDIAC